MDLSDFDSLLARVRADHEANPVFVPGPSVERALSLEEQGLVVRVTTERWDATQARIASLENENATLLRLLDQYRGQIATKDARIAELEKEESTRVAASMSYVWTMKYPLDDVPAEKPEPNPFRDFPNDRRRMGPQ